MMFLVSSFQFLIRCDVETKKPETKASNWKLEKKK